jgi:hypothetical protein
LVGSIEVLGKKLPAGQELKLIFHVKKEASYCLSNLNPWLRASALAFAIQLIKSAKTSVRVAR